MYPSSVEVFVVVWLRAYPSVVRRCLREEFGTPSRLEILLSEGEDVELGARTSEHIIVFAFDPLSLNPLSLLLCIASFILMYLIFLHLCLTYIHIALPYYMLGCVCASLVLNHESFI